MARQEARGSRRISDLQFAMLERLAATYPAAYLAKSLAESAVLACLRSAHGAVIPLLIERRRKYRMTEFGQQLLKNCRTLRAPPKVDNCGRKFRDVSNLRYYYYRDFDEIYAVRCLVCGGSSKIHRSPYHQYSCDGSFMPDTIRFIVAIQPDRHDARPKNALTVDFESWGIADAALRTLASTDGAEITEPADSEISRYRVVGIASDAKKIPRLELAVA
jgi:hypothetical protein